MDFEYVLMFVLVLCLPEWFKLKIELYERIFEGK